ncbi:hypothetical protein [Amycolatopsis pithecellobii]|uniref:Uncharacterized protein n=1 Tax=Amycolatopsis pithecellobii TaxID=664692 RepID=A0A6N7YZP3_9PSEU|nr:hypothetical protein [Amycolatopsis pithecellobii]MTD57428.1 hypothetical protein [Amycolatopsis pithecellobii]
MPDGGRDAHLDEVAGDQGIEPRCGGTDGSSADNALFESFNVTLNREILQDPST